jgi:hypothetical protein
MRYRIAVLAAAILSLGWSAPSPASSDLVSRMAALNGGLQSYTASLHARVSLQTFPFLSANLDGTYYFKQPDRYRVAFSSGLPLIAEKFNNLYGHIEPASRWRSVYDVTVVSDNGHKTTFRLVPRKRGNVASIDAVADDSAATVTSMRWNYVNGGFASMANHYARVNGYNLVASQTGEVHEPGYAGTIDTTISGYHINANVPDSVFANP